jgi:dipeptide/tripeptide permease
MSTRSLLLFCALPLFIGLERLAHYLARAVLALHVVSSPPDGFGMSTASVGSIFAQLAGFGVVSPILGGLVAMALGPAVTLAIGAFIASAGYAVLGVGSVELLPVAIGLIAAGTGMCRPSGIALAASELRDRPEGVRSALFFLLYVAINAGAVVGPFAAGIGGGAMGFRVVFGISAGIALVAAFVGGGLAAALRYAGGSGDSSSSSPPSPGGRAAFGVILLWVALAPSILMQAAEVRAQYTIFGGPSGMGNTLLHTINPIVVMVVSLGACAALLVVSLAAKWTIPTLSFIGVALVVWGMASGLLAAAPRGGGALPLLIAVAVVSAAGEAVVGPLSLGRAAASSIPRFSTLFVAGWLAATGAVSMLAHAVIGHVDAQIVSGASAVFSVLAGAGLIALAKPLERAFFSEVRDTPSA